MIPEPNEDEAYETSAIPPASDTVHSKVLDVPSLSRVNAAGQETSGKTPSNTSKVKSYSTGFKPSVIVTTRLYTPKTVSCSIEIVAEYVLPLPVIEVDVRVPESRETVGVVVSSTTPVHVTMAYCVLSDVVIELMSRAHTPVGSTTSSRVIGILAVVVFPALSSAVIFNVSVPPAPEYVSTAVHSLPDTAMIPEPNEDEAYETSAIPPASDTVHSKVLDVPSLSRVNAAGQETSGKTPSNTSKVKSYSTGFKPSVIVTTRLYTPKTVSCSIEIVAEYVLPLPVIEVDVRVPESRETVGVVVSSTTPVHVTMAYCVLSDVVIELMSRAHTPVGDNSSVIVIVALPTPTFEEVSVALTVTMQSLAAKPYNEIYAPNVVSSCIDNSPLTPQVDVYDGSSLRPVSSIILQANSPTSLLLLPPVAVHSTKGL